MTTYLWYSAQQEQARRGKEERTMRTFFSTSSPKSEGFLIYLDLAGEPVRVTEVSSQPECGSSFKDMRLVATVEKPTLLRCMYGKMQPEGEEFCREKGITPAELLRYTYEKNQECTYTRTDVKVAKPLRFKG